MATLNVEEAPISELIEWLDSTLEFLEDEDSDLDHADMLQHREQAMDVGTRLLDDRADDLTDDQSRHITDVVCMLDRVGH
jgi:hypothetical protein